MFIREQEFLFDCMPLGERWTGRPESKKNIQFSNSTKASFCRTLMDTRDSLLLMVATSAQMSTKLGIKASEASSCHGAEHALMKTTEITLFVRFDLFILLFIYCIKQCTLLGSHVTAELSVAALRLLAPSSFGSCHEVYN
jgi:hypothetical protein